MKYAEPRPYADPERAARRLLEIANEPVQDGRIHIEKINIVNRDESQERVRPLASMTFDEQPAHQ
jgi:hypothetical protein